MDSNARAVRYGTAVIALTAAILLRWAVDPWLGDKYPLATLFGAVGITVWVAGVGPALAVTLLGYALASYLFISPRGSLAWGGSADAIAFVLYFVTCAMMIGFGEAIRRARLKAAAATDYLNRALVGASMVAWEWEPDAHRFTVTENAKDFLRPARAFAPARGWFAIHPSCRRASAFGSGAAVAQVRQPLSLCVPCPASGRRANHVGGGARHRHAQR
jgi:hypothetical protein